MEARSLLSQVPANEADCIRNEIAQCKVRIFIVVCLSFLFLKTGHTTHPVFIWLVIYTLALFFVSLRYRIYAPWRYVLGIVLDTSCSIGGLLVVGVDAAILFVVLIQIAFGAGVRYGLGYLTFAVGCVEISLCGMFAFSLYWRAQGQWIFVFCIGIPFVGYYVRMLLKNLREGKLRAEQREQSVLELLARIGHEVRTPLQAMLVTCDVLGQSSAHIEFFRRVNGLRDSIDSLARVATDVISMARLHSDPNRETKEACDLHEIVGRACVPYADSIRSKGLNFSVDIVLSGSSNYRVPRIWLEQLLRNLLSNAERCTNHGAIRVISRIGQLDDGRHELRIDVIDTGVGIKKADMQRIRGATRLNERMGVSPYAGAGLGLAISYELVTRLGGALYVDSEVGRGSSFQVTIPLSPVAQVPRVTGPKVKIIAYRNAAAIVGRIAKQCEIDFIRARYARECSSYASETAVVIAISQQDLTSWTVESKGLRSKPQCVLIVNSEPADLSGVASSYPGTICFWLPECASDADLRIAMCTVSRCIAGEQSHPAGESNEALKGKSVLVVNDSRLNRELECIYLSQAGANVHSVENGRAALQFIGHFPEKIDAVLLDWNMDDGGGAEFLEALRRARSSYNPCVVVLTGEDRTLVEPMARRLGAEDVLQQPIRPDRVVASLVSALFSEKRANTDIELARFDGVSEVLVDQQYVEMLREGVSAEKVRRLVTIFVDETSELIAKLHTASEGHSSDEYDRCLHAISGIAFAAGAVRLAERAYQLRNSVGEVDAVSTNSLVSLEKIWSETAVAVAQLEEKLR